MDKNFIYNNKLNNECNVFCYYLINQKPSKYVLEKYQDAHRVGSINRNIDSNFDKLLISIAKISFFTKLVDVYTSIFFKGAVFRKKLILLLAILESCAPTCYYLDSVTISGKAMLFVRIFQKVLLSMFSLLLSIIILMPLHVIYKIVSKAPGP